MAKPSSFALIAVIQSLLLFSGQTVLGTVAVSAASAQVKEEKAESFADLVDRYFDFCFAMSPNWGSQAGFHQYDRMVEDFSPAAIKKNIEKLKVFETRFDAPYPGLSRSEKLDLEMLRAAVKAQLFDLTQYQSYVIDPDKYSSYVGDCVFTLVKRDFAPLPQRLESAICRMEAVPAVLDCARVNLKAERVPKIYAEIALEQIPGTIEMFKTTIPQAFASVKDPVLQARFEKARQKVVASLTDYEKFVRSSILPKCKESFAIGKDYFAKKLLYEEMEDEALDSLLARGYKELARLKGRFTEVAAEIDASKTPSEVFSSIASDHPQARQLISSTSACLDRLARFCEDRKIVSLPVCEKLTVAETPAFERALTFASMDTPGPYEKTAKEAYYYVTPAEADWDAKRVEEHLRFYSYADIINTSVHEAYPGHYVQFLWVKNAPSKVRKLIGCSSNAEGWAHYCEEMMLENGLTISGEAPDRKLTMVQLHDALLRVCRYIVGIEMHTKGMTFKQGVAFFMKEGFMEEANALRETKRGTKDPTYLVYTLGKLKILSLRDEYKTKVGPAFTLQDFHDRFLKCGFPPLKIVRSEVLGE